jgi:hypothetical protein
MREPKPRPLPLDLHGLSGRVEIFRISGAKKRDRDVELWLAGDRPELRSIAQTWFAHMRRCGDDVRELVHDGCPVACVADAPFGYVNTYKRHVNVGFFYGAMLADPSGILEGSGKRMRHVKLRPQAQLHDEALRDLICSAYLDIRVRLACSAP